MTGWHIKNEAGQMLAIDERGGYTWVAKEEDALLFCNKASAEALTRVPSNAVQAWRSIVEAS